MTRSLAFVLAALVAGAALAAAGPPPGPPPPPAAPAPPPWSLHRAGPVLAQPPLHTIALR